VLSEDFDSKTHSNLLVARGQIAGNKLWEVAFFGRTSELTLAGDHMLIVGTEGGLVGFDLRARKSVWFRKDLAFWPAAMGGTFGTDDDHAAPPAVGLDGTIYVPHGSLMYAIDPITGQTKWKTSGTIGGLNIALTGDVLYAVQPTTPGESTALGISAVSTDGAILWNVAGHFDGPPAVASNGDLVIAAYLTDSTMEIRRYKKADGSLVSQSSAINTYRSAIALDASDVAYLFGSEAISARSTDPTGTPVSWDTPVDGGGFTIFLPPTISNAGNVIIPSGNTILDVH
jgi:outer membrane protein assembly factor BamB